MMAVMSLATFAQQSTLPNCPVKKGLEMLKAAMMGTIPSDALVAEIKAALTAVRQ